MDWRRAPKLIRELRIAYAVPELRALIAQNIGLLIARWSWGAVCIIIIAPVLAIGMTGQVLADIGEWLGKMIDPIWRPSRWLRKRERANIEASHAIISPEEIRLRAYGEKPQVLE